MLEYVANIDIDINNYIASDDYIN